jgi:cellulose synthase/poly-beta-1,6-N-acetylglucosamine synthase-like glycosyltransferase
LPIYTIICALYREAPVVENLVAAIRALDYPGIMAPGAVCAVARPTHALVQGLDASLSIERFIFVFNGLSLATEPVATSSQQYIF